MSRRTVSTVSASKFEMMTRLPFLDVPLRLPLASMRWMTSLGMSLPLSVLKFTSKASQSCPELWVWSPLKSKDGVMRTMLFFWELSFWEDFIFQPLSCSRSGSVEVRNSMMASSLFICQVPRGSVIWKPACMSVPAARSSASLFLVR